MGGKVMFLKDLHASSNSFTGSLPMEYYRLKKLQELYLDNNMLEGILPQDAEPIYHGLQEFSIHSNNFDGDFPVQLLEDTVRIKRLSLHQNRITGTITPN